MGYLLFIRCILQAYPSGYPCISKRIYMCISSLSNGISTIYPTHSPSISNWLSTPIQQFIQTYPKGYPISNWISIGISGLICGQGIQAGSCIAIQICILAPGPASSAASDGLPPCSERKRGVRNACSYPTWAACVAAPGRATLLPPPLLRGSHQCFAAGSYQLQVLQAWVCDIADP